MQLLIGFSLGALIALLAWRAHALSRSGAYAATLVGGLIFGLGGFPWAVLLLAFFISSSGLSRLFRRRKAALDEKFSKGSQRDWGQVFANGGLGALLALVGILIPDQAWVWLAYAGAMAAVNADTWATELGVLNRTPPRLITTGRRVEPGTSGAISFLGTLAALAGATLISGLAWLLSALALDELALGLLGSTSLTPAPVSNPWIALLLFVLPVFGGMAGAFFDSLLGASVQAIYYCPACRKETERSPRHLCGTETVHRRGWRWLNNDLVNFACSLVGALAAAGVWKWLS